jgi:hypothetical protein
MSVGQQRSVSLTPEQGFGVRDPDAVIWVDKGEFPSDVALGDQFEAEADSGDLVLLTVVEVEEQTVALDTNPPLAGQTVRVDLILDALFAARPERAKAASARFRRPVGLSEPLIAASRLLEGGSRRYENTRADRHGRHRPPPEPVPAKRSLNHDTVGYSKIRHESEKADAASSASDRNSTRPTPPTASGSGDTG